MPYYKKKAAARKYARKPYLRRRKNIPRGVRSVKRGTLVYKGQPGIADRAILKMKYRDNYVLTNSVGSPFVQRYWRLNSIYDPDGTGTGHQPLTYDQWNLFYQTYRVYKCDVIIDLANEENEACQIAWIVQPDDNAVLYSDSCFEQPHTFTKILGGINGQNRAQIRRSVYMPRMIGMTPAQFKANTNVSTLFGQNPNTNIFGILVAESIDDSTVPNVSVNITLNFHVELFDRKEMPISEPNSQLKQLMSTAH